MNSKAREAKKEKNKIDQKTGRRNGHPQLFLIEVVDADGNKRKLLSTKNVPVLQINSSRTMHAAWTKQQTVIKDNKKADKLNSFFA